MHEGRGLPLDRLDDPRMLRALAHPARQRLITELFSGEVLTATEAASLVDLTPSATSWAMSGSLPMTVALSSARKLSGGVNAPTATVSVPSAAAFR